MWRQRPNRRTHSPDQPWPGSGRLPGFPGADAGDAWSPQRRHRPGASGRYTFAHSSQGCSRMTLYGYARVSVREPEDKNLDLQVERLVRAGCSLGNIRAEEASGARNARGGLLELLDLVVEADTLVVTHIDWLSRGLTHGLQVIEGLHRPVSRGRPNSSSMGVAQVFPKRSSAAISIAENAAGFWSTSSRWAVAQSRRVRASVTPSTIESACFRMNAAPLSTVSPVTYSRGHPSPYPTSPESECMATMRFSARARLAEAWRKTVRKGTGKLEISNRWIRNAAYSVLVRVVKSSRHSLAY